MMMSTHIAIGAAATSLILGTANPWIILIAAVTSQIPDLDTTRSIAGRILYPLALQIERRYAHRTVTHSLYCVAAIAALFLPVGYFLGWKVWAAIPIGHLIGGALPDCFTKKGASIFWPDNRPVVVPGNPKARIISGSVAEYWILSGALALLIISCNLSSAGGLSENFGQAFFQNTETAATTFRKSGSTNQIWAQVEGSNLATGAKISGKFEIVDIEGSDLVIIDVEKRLQKVGNSGQIKGTVKVSIGDAHRISSREYELLDSPIDDWVNGLPIGSHVSGTLKLEDAEEVIFPKSLQYMETVTGSGEAAKFEYATPAQIRKVLGGSWILSGKVVVKNREK
jgi:inner membrane protein